MIVADRKNALENEREFGLALDRYAGRWVGVCDHKVVADADTLEELREQLKAAGRTEFEVIQVPDDPNASCFF